MDGEAEWGEDRGVWVPHLPAGLDLGEGAIPLGLKVKEKQTPDPSAPSFPESLGMVWGPGTLNSGSLSG